MVAKKKVRLQIAISKEAQEEINLLKKKLDLSTTTDVIRSSLSLARYLELQKESGNEIIVRNKDTGKEKEIIFVKP